MEYIVALANKQIKYVQYLAAIYVLVVFTDVY